jgi:hypothetical protein
MTAFQLMNLMQRNAKKLKAGYWSLDLPNSYKCVGNIIKLKDGSYGVSNDLTSHKTFMGALASLRKLFAQMLATYKTPVQTFFFAGVALECHDFNAQSQSFNGYKLKDGQNNVVLFGNKHETMTDLSYTLIEVMASARGHEMLTLRKAQLLVTDLIKDYR